MRIAPFDSKAVSALAFTLCMLALAAPADADIPIAILPAETTVAHGEVFEVELTVTEPSTSFNGYGATVLYDSDALIFLRQTPLSLQEGPLMVEACGLRFHDFFLAPDSTQMTIGHVLLCAQTNVAGPGVVYRLTFQAKHVDLVTTIAFAEVPEFYDEGITVGPVFSEDAIVIVGEPSATTPVATSSLKISAWPNPFNPRSRIRVEVGRPGFLELDVVTIAGRHVRSLARAWHEPGLFFYEWNGQDRNGRPVVSGVYLVRAVHGGNITNSKITLIE